MFLSPFDAPDDAIKQCDVVFVSDFFAEDLRGGAELTTEALIQSCPKKVHKLHSRDVTVDAIRAGIDKFWVFGNFSHMQMQLVPHIVGNLKYSIVEYDYKYCKYRSPEKHAATGVPCDCAEQPIGKLVSAFYYGAKGLWWMSERQKDTYETLYPFLKERGLPVLSSVFAPETLLRIRNLRNENIDKQREKWIVLASDSWIKGQRNSQEYCKENNIEYELVGGVRYNEFLQKLAEAKGLVYLPPGGDTCPRLTIEAKLLGCELVLNDNVQHKDEEWFATDDLAQIEAYLLATPKLFWDGIAAMEKTKSTISGYLTTYNCIERGYPYVECIKSLMQFCDEICVVDGGSTDGTWEMLSNWSNASDRVFVKQISRDWNSPRAAVFDGEQKAEARKMCTGDFCWQSDADEIVHEQDVPKIQSLVSRFPTDVDVVALPVIEYWGGPDKVRMDINPQKWRLSRNKPNMTHGLPVSSRLFDEENRMYSAGSDGCDMIYSDTLEPVPTLGFVNLDAVRTQKAALEGDVAAVRSFETWFNNVTRQLPAVHHYSWYDIERKIRHYKEFWQVFWEQLFDRPAEDVAENNMFFDVPWSEVTDDMVKDRARELAEETGGHVFHTKWNPSKKTPWIAVDRTEPEVMVSSKE